MPRSWASEPLAIAHPLFSCPTRLVGGHLDVVEEHLVEVGVLGSTISGSGRTVMPGRVHVDEHDADALVLRGVGSVRQNRKQKSA